MTTTTPLIRTGPTKGVTSPQRWSRTVVTRGYCFLFPSGLVVMCRYITKDNRAITQMKKCRELGSV